MSRHLPRESHDFSRAEEANRTRQTARVTDGQVPTDSGATARPGRVLAEPLAVKRARKLLDAVIASRAGAEDRAQQHEMTELVATAAATGEPLIVQAGTGTGKSLAYLCGGVGAGARMVVSTATKQLSDQLITSDVPLVEAVARKVTRRPVDAVALKGRANYLCLAKVNELTELEAQAPPIDVELDLGIEPAPLAKTADDDAAAATTADPRRPSPADLKALNELLAWADTKPESGDRSAAPAAGDRAWSQVSMDSAGCPGARVCRFGDDCYAEAARADARDADIVVINHALLAQDLISPSPLFNDRDLIVVDEVHELEGYLSSAWGHEVSAGLVERVVTNAVRRIPRGNEQTMLLGQAALADSAAVAEALRVVAAQLWDAELPSSVDGPLASLERHATELASALDALAKASDEAAAPAIQGARGQLIELTESIAAVRRADPEVVRWSEPGRDGAPGLVQAAPLNVGGQFCELIGDRALVATSATASVAGDFEPVAAMLGLTGSGGSWTGVDVGSPFDFQQQAILYIPKHLPEPVGKERADHTAAVLDELTDLVNAAGGRTLALFTTTTAARNAAAHLHSRVSVTVLSHGELPAAVLAEEFADDETSVLCATMGMWTGLNVVGPACSLVVIDKIPFVPMDNPLASARRANADAAGRSGFREVFVNHAALMLTQGTGRLIRSRDDRGVVAILDPRLHTKGYGTIMLRSLPPMWRTTDPDLVRAALARLSAGEQ